MKSNEALAILNEGKDYEEKIVADLSEFFLSKLDGIEDLSEAEKDRAHNILEQLLKDSVRHTDIFNGLIERVLNHGGDSY